MKKVVLVDKYQAYAIDRARASGASEQDLQETARQMESFKKLYANPIFNAAVTLLEPFPVGLLVTLVSRRGPPEAGGRRRGLTPV